MKAGKRVRVSSRRRPTARDRAAVAIARWGALPRKERKALAEFLREDAKEVADQHDPDDAVWSVSWVRSCRALANVIDALEGVLRGTAVRP
jgi:hypothetical protein